MVLDTNRGDGGHAGTSTVSNGIVDAGLALLQGSPFDVFFLDFGAEIGNPLRRLMERCLAVHNQCVCEHIVLRRPTAEPAAAHRSFVRSLSMV